MPDVWLNERTSMHARVPLLVLLLLFCRRHDASSANAKVSKDEKKTLTDPTRTSHGGKKGKGRK